MQPFVEARKAMRVEKIHRVASQVDNDWFPSEKINTVHYDWREMQIVDKETIESPEASAQIKCIHDPAYEKSKWGSLPVLPPHTRVDEFNFIGY